MALVAALAFVVVGCASTPLAPPTRRCRRRPTSRSPIDGRLSARRGNDAIAVSFAWTHASPRDEIVITTPLGGALAELSGDASTRRVEVRTADGRRRAASDWATLTERTVGFPLPVGGTRFLGARCAARGRPACGGNRRAGRVGVLRQDGCEIVYAYADEFGAPARRGCGSPATISNCASSSIAGAPREPLAVGRVRPQ